MDCIAVSGGFIMPVLDMDCVAHSYREQPSAEMHTGRFIFDSPQGVGDLKYRILRKTNIV